MNKKLEIFFIDAVKYLKEEGCNNNSIEILAPLIQNIKSEPYERLYRHINSCKDYNFSYCNNSDGYTNGTLTVRFNFKAAESKTYIFDFLLDKRLTKYCDCKETDYGYDPEHQCTGENCDFIAPKVNVTYVLPVGTANWNGKQKDLWKFEREFSKTINEDEEIIRLKENIADMQRKLAKMEQEQKAS